MRMIRIITCARALAGSLRAASRTQHTSVPVSEFPGERHAEHPLYLPPAAVPGHQIGQRRGAPRSAIEEDRAVDRVCSVDARQAYSDPPSHIPHEVLTVGKIGRGACVEYRACRCVEYLDRLDATCSVPIEQVQRDL